jgi:hypothetical protein
VLVLLVWVLCASARGNDTLGPLDERDYADVVYDLASVQIWLVTPIRLRIHLVCWLPCFDSY